LDWYEENRGVVDGLMLLQPTSPFRTRKTIDRGIRLFERNGRKPVLGVTKTHSHPSWTFRIKEKYLAPFMGMEGMNTRSQDLEPAYVANGSFYLISGDTLRKEKSFVTSSTLPLIVESQMESLDIDTEEDWEFAEYYISKYLLSKSENYGSNNS